MRYRAKCRGRDAIVCFLPVRKSCARLPVFLARLPVRLVTTSGEFGTTSNRPGTTSRWGFRAESAPLHETQIWRYTPQNSFASRPNTFVWSDCKEIGFQKSTENLPLRSGYIGATKSFTDQHLWRPSGALICGFPCYPRLPTWAQSLRASGAGTVATNGEKPRKL